VGSLPHWADCARVQSGDSALWYIVRNRGTKSGSAISFLQFQIA